ncbi:hypothetical protein K488DRAFT_72901 [Vararia minispora EC-137]|uniref:Uncharacterized protein n=1 Tax=Vararia minispora EC-137 TaxID=1314806 RepID=A0ACB8QCM8_9AGAM|nr:hypothetical protein K488DRAFT_72901 [Vararia minispora EC-137]
MALLEQAFPSHLRIRPGPRPPPYTPSRAQSFADELAAALQAHVRPDRPVPPAFDRPPDEWTYATLLEWMCTLTRAHADDAEWVRRLRACVMAHSEQLCVALLSALGVPIEGADDELRPANPQHDSAIPSPTAVRAAPTPPTQIPHRAVVTTPPASLDDAPDADADAFRLTISALLPAPEPAPAPYGTPRYVSPVRPRMESIGESDGERDGEGQGETRGRREGSATARAGTPVGRIRARPAVVARPSSSSSDSTEDEEDDELPSLFGLALATAPRDTSDAVLPSPRPAHALPIPVTSARPASTSAFPIPVTSALPRPAPAPTYPIPITTPRPPKKGPRVAHVLSGAPGHAGYTWRPGGPLFAMSFGIGGAEREEEEERVSEMVPRAIFDIKRPSLRHRSRSRDARKAVVLAVPPNTPTDGLAALPDVNLVAIDALAVVAA